MTYPYLERPCGAVPSRVGALMAVATVALAAKAGVINATSISIALMRTKAALGEDHVLHRVMVDFSAKARALSGDADALAQAGDHVLRTLERDSWPSATGRADLDG